MKPHEWAENPSPPKRFDPTPAPWTEAAIARTIAVDVVGRNTYWHTREWLADGTSRLVNFGHKINPPHNGR